MAAGSSRVVTTTPAAADGTRESRLTPVAVDGLEQGVRGVFAGLQRSYAILADGSLVGWGLNAVDLRGFDGSPTRPVSGARTGGRGRGYGGRQHPLSGLTSSAVVLEWGWPLGRRRVDVSDWELPRQLDLQAKVRAIAAGRDHALVLTCDGQLLACGDNALRRLGIGEGEDPSRPTPVIGLDGVGVRAIAAGWNRSFVLTDDGAVLPWGWTPRGRSATSAPAACCTPSPQHRRCVPRCPPNWRQTSALRRHRSRSPPT